MQIEIVRGAVADSLLGEETFRAEWSRLREQCPWATAFQGPGFVLTWFHTYRDLFEPFLLLSRDDGHLVGLLPLAVSRGDGRVVVAGHWQAEYQAWICPPDLGDRFAWLAVRSLQREYPSAALRFRYLPPRTPTGWLADPEAKRICYLQPHRRPLLRFGDGEEITKSLNKSRIKSHIGLLKKMGPIEFKRVTDLAEFADYLDDIIRCHDSRHLAMRGSAPFRNDILKRPFHLALMEVSGLLHVTVLKVGDRLVSAHLGACGSKEVELGLMVHDPWLAKSSPGKLHTLLLARMLMHNGYKHLDLTAGGEPYKERFANAWDEVHTLTVLPTPHQRRMAVIQGTVREAAKAALARFRITAIQANSYADRLKGFRPVDAPGALLRSARAWIGSRHETRIFSRETAQAPMLDLPGPIRRDSLEDLLAYRPVTGRPSSREFMAAALERIETGQHVYTYSEGGRLLHVSWLVEHPTESLTSRKLPGFPLPTGSALILEPNTSPEARGLGLGALALRAMLNDTARDPKIERVFLAVPADSGPTRRSVEEIGFVHECSLFEEIRFGWRRRWTTMPCIDPPSPHADLFAVCGQGNGGRT